MRKIFAVAALAALIASPAFAGWVKTYTSEDAARRYCRSPVVWINTNTMIFHKQGTRYYGNTKVGV